MKPGNKNSYKSLSDLEVNGKNYKYYSLKKAELNEFFVPGFIVYI